MEKNKKNDETKKVLGNEARKHFLFTVWTFAKYMYDCMNGAQNWDSNYGRTLIGLCDSAFHFMNVTDGIEFKQEETFEYRVKHGQNPPMYGKFFGILLHNPQQSVVSDEERAILESIPVETMWDAGVTHIININE